MNKLKSQNWECTFSNFRALKTQVAWATNSRSDKSYETAVLAQITEESFMESNCKIVKKINQTVQQLEENQQIVLEFPQLDSSFLKLNVIQMLCTLRTRKKILNLDILFSWQIKKYMCHPIYLISHKSKISFRSVPGSE